MLGGTTKIGNVLGTAPVATADTNAIRSFMKACASIGLHLILCEPGTKRPVDMRSSVQRRKEDSAASDAAMKAGRRNWVNVKSAGGVHLATDQATLLDRYLKRYRETYGANCAVNLAVAVGPSRLVVVDCDTADQVAAFLRDMGYDPQTQPVPPTVRSPGARDEHGNWVHRDGGHFYFTLPDGVELPTATGSFTAAGGYAVLWGGRYVLIPPSVRPEGAYVYAGSDHVLPESMYNAITAHAQARLERRVTLNPDAEFNTGIDTWADSVPWEELLSAAGWTLTTRPDSCGCDVYTAPGAHASPKSGTAHDVACGAGRYSESNAPLHIWTDNPGEPLASFLSANGGAKTITKLQVVAALYFKGDVGTAVAELGLLNKGDLSFDGGAITSEAGVSMAHLDETPPAGGLDQTIDWTPPPAFDQGGIVGGPIAATTDRPQEIILPTDSPAETQRKIDAMRNPAVDEARERARIRAEAHVQLASSTPVPTVSDPPFLDPATRVSAPAYVIPFASPAGQLVGDDDGCGPLWEPVIMTAAPSNMAAVQYAQIDPRAREFIESHSGQPYVYGGQAADDTGFAGHMAKVHDALIQADQYARVFPFANPTGILLDGDETDGPLTEPRPERYIPQGSAGGEDAGTEPTDPHMPNIQPFSYWRSFPKPEFVVDGLVEQGGLVSIIGPPGVGKSAVAIDLAASIATGKPWQGRAVLRQRALYMPGEGLSGAVQRLLAWEAAHSIGVDDDVHVSDAIIQAGAPADTWKTLVAYILRNQIGVLVLDTYARMTTGVEENSATDVGKVVLRLDRVRKLTGCTIIVVHHTAKGSEAGRGSSALNGALETELLIREGTWWNELADGGGFNAPPGKVLEMSVVKQKNAAQPEEPIPLLMMEMHGSVVMTGPTGSVSPDLFDQLAMPTERSHEPLIETAIRIAAAAEDHPIQGVTRSDLKDAVRPDPGTAKRKDAQKAWKVTIGRATDLALRLGLLGTLSGSREGARYVRGDSTPDQARARIAGEMLDPE